MSMVHTEYLPDNRPIHHALLRHGAAQNAIAVYLAYVRDPAWQRPPNTFELRLVLEYCSYYVCAPLYDQLMPAAVLAELRAEVVTIQGAGELALWLRRLRQQLGIEPL